MEIEILGFDLAKTGFSTARRGSQWTCGTSLQSRSRRVSRDGSPILSTIIALEACSLAYHWTRCFIALGIQVRVTSPRICVAVREDEEERPQRR